MAGEISLERQNLAHSSNGGDFQLESQQHWREENVLFSVVEAAVAAPMLTQTPAVVAADLRSNYFWYQSRSVRWLDKKLKDDARRRRRRKTSAASSRIDSTKNYYLVFIFTNYIS